MINTEYNKFKARFNEETEMPHYIKSNNQWVKDLYKDLKTRQKEVPPDMGSTALGKVNSLVSNFEKDAENIYNLNVDGRENPALKEYMKTRYAHPAIQNMLVENKSKPQNTVVNSGVTATNKLYNENSGKLLKTPETMKKSTEIVKLNSVENTPSASNNAAPAQTENQPITAGSSPIQGKEGLSEKEKPVINNDIQGTAGDNKNTKESIPVIIYDPDSNSFENSDSSKITEKTSGTDKQVYLPDEKYDVIWKYTGEVSDCLGSDLEKTAASADWLMPDEYVPVYDKETGKVSYCMAKDLREKLQSGKWALDTDGVKLINKCTGEEVSCKGNEIADSIQNGGCLSPNTRVTVYNRITGEASECYASEIAEKRKGDFATAKDGIVVINAYTGERSTCSADELYAKIQSGGFYSEKQRVPVYDPISGKTSYCWAYELADKKKNKVWVVASDGVERIDPLSGDRRTVKAYEVEGEANSGTSYSPGQRINLYDPSSGAANACFAYELKGYKQKGFLTGDETVKIYNGVTFKEADCKSKNLAGMRGGKGSSKWYTGDEIVTLYDAWNKPVKVKANAAASRLTGQNRLYTSKMFPDNDEIWASIINKTPQQLQDEYNKKLAETFTNASKLT
ncbi:MAG: hypothetical protein Q8873_03210, partial [Bacillota bacterium]|nr:hypothetical protein [Bacillota bacterium]